MQNSAMRKHKGRPLKNWMNIAWRAKVHVADPKNIMKRCDDDEELF